MDGGFNITIEHRAQDIKMVQSDIEPNNDCLKQTKYK